MPIFSQGYQKWDGKLHGRPTPLLAVAGLEFRIQIRRVSLWILYALALMATMVGATVVYFFANGFAGLPGSPAPGVIELSRTILWIGLVFVMPIFAAVVGSGAIARDRRFNAHLMFFSKALSPLDYLVGKYLSLGVLVFATGALPAALLFLAGYPKLVAELEPWIVVRFLVALLVHAALFTAYYLALVLVFSSLTKNRSLPGILFFAAIWILFLFGRLFDIVHVVRAPDELGIQPALSSASVDDEGRPVAVQVENASTRTVRRVIACRRPPDFDREAWLATGPDDWQGDRHVSARLESDREGRRILAVLERSVLVWDARTGERIADLSLDSTANAFAVAPDGSWFAIASARLSIHDAATGEVRQASRLDGRVPSLAVDPSGRRLAGSTDRGVRIWDVARAEVVGEADLAAEVSSVAWFADGRRVAAAVRGGRIDVVDASTGKVATSWDTTRDELVAVAVSPDERWVAFGSAYGAVGVLDARSGKVQMVVDQEHQYSKIEDLVFAPGSDWMASSGADGRVLIWDHSAGNVKKRLRSRPGQPGNEMLDFGPPATGLAVVSDGTEVAAVLADGSARVWDVGSGEVRLRLVGRGWHVLEVDDEEETWTATPFEWIRVLDPFALLTRTADDFYPSLEPPERALGEAARPLASRQDDGPEIALPWWQIAGICLGVIGGGYALVLRRLRSFERREG